jgi:outer membrane receptor protein involved in Fe transport
MRLAIALFLAVLAALGQTGASGVPVSGTVRDPANLAIPAARVLLQGAQAQAETFTNDRGEFRFDSVPQGSYEIRIAIPGFEHIATTVRVGSRAPRPVSIQLSLARLEETIEVPDQPAEVSTDSASNVDAISVERSMLDNLPVLGLDYIAALSRFLDPGSPGGSGTSIIVDGMEMRNVGVTASAIQEIRINNNPYTVEYPRWSRRRIEVITKSSADAYHGTFNFLLRDYRLNARDALAIDRPQEQRRIFEGSLFGPVGKSRNTSFLLSGAREEEDLFAVVFAQGPRGPINQNVPTPRVNTVASLRLSHQLSEQQTLFVQLNFQDRWQDNVGVGGTSLAETGTQSRFREDEFVFNHRGVITPNLLSQFRILIGRYWSPTKSNLDAARVVVSDAVTQGGAQADRLSTEAHTSITWLLTQTAGKHTLKYGFNIPDWSRRGLSDRSNQIGTFSYASLADLEAARPFAAVVQRGDPRVVFIEKNVGGFFQDEWQIRPDFSLAMGLRYDWQNNFGDTNNLAPRLAIAWAPFKARKTVIRTGAGFFFDRSGPGPIYDIRRFDGMQLRRYVLSAAQIPPDLSDDTLLAFPTSVHRIGGGTELPNTMQFSFGIEQQLAKNTTMAVSYVGTRAVQQFRSRDANAPLPTQFASRPDSTLNVLREIESAGRMESNGLEITFRGNLAPRVTGMAQYVFSRTLTDTNGLNWFPANSFAPEGEWGRADSDRRHRLNFLATASLHRWANFGASLSLLSGIPFNITTGRDDNRDGMAIDRPAGTTRNTGLGPGSAVIDLRWFRDFRLVREKKDKSPSLTLSVDAFNLLNSVNYANYVGSLTSPFFGHAVETQPARRIQIGCRLQF